MENKGLSIVIYSEDEYNKMIDFLGKDILYIPYQSQMSLRETGIVLWAKKKTNVSIGSVGYAEHQRKLGIRTVEFKHYFKS